MTLKSMTAFGSSEQQTTTHLYRCEVRSLNSRFCDVSIKMPRSLLALEPLLLNLTKERIARGKIDVFIDVIALDRKVELPTLNVRAAEYHLALGKQLQKLAGGGLGELSVYELMRLEGVLQAFPASADREEEVPHEAPLITVLDDALAKLVQQRLREGEALGRALAKILDTMGELRSLVEGKRVEIQKNLYATYRRRLDKLLESLEETGAKIKSILPEERMLSEIALLTDRSDVEEELTRLEAHEQEFRRLLQGGEEVGRKLDFLCQEMQREVNTLANKLNHLDVSQHSLDLKQTIERLRQQVQNLE